MSNNIIFNKLLNDISAFVNNNKNINKRDNDIYEKFNNITNLNKFSYFFIIVIVFVFFNYFDIKLKHLFSLIFSAIIIIFLIGRDNYNLLKFIDKKQTQLDFINSLLFNDDKFIKAIIDKEFFIKPEVNKSYLYLNPIIVQFYYDIKEYSQYNISAYLNSIIHTNNLIGINYKTKLGVENPFQNYSVAKEEYTKSLNSLKNVIYCLPISNNGSTDNKFEKSLIILQKLLYNHLININDICDRFILSNGLNIDSTPVSILKSNNYVSPNNENNSTFLKYDFY